MQGWPSTLSSYGSVWRYASLEDLVAIIKAVSVICLIFFTAMFLIRSSLSPLYITNQLASTYRNVGRARICLSAFKIVAPMMQASGMVNVELPFY